MKSVLLHINDDHAQEDRILVALALARTHGSQITCLQTSPINDLAMCDSVGGFFPINTIIKLSEELEQEQLSRAKRRLRNEGVNCRWKQVRGEPAGALIKQARLSDVIVLSRVDTSAGEGPAPADIIGEVVVHARTPVLVVPPSYSSFRPDGPIVVAWNGGAEAAHSLRMTVSMLHSASKVTFVTVGDNNHEYTAADGRQYLKAHGINADAKSWSCNGNDLAPTLLTAATALNAGCIVMGAYSSSRLKEFILGGVTRDLLTQTTIPLLVTH